MTRFHPIRERLRRIGLLAGLLAFVVQMMVWTVTMPAMALDAAGVGAGAASAGVETITICTANGVKTITLGPNGEPVADQDGGATGAAAGHCPLCPTMAGTAPPPLPPMAALPALRLAMADARALPGGVIAAGWFLSSLQARAPPAAG
ncbi:DUF2946 family protein [Azospirillum brasilense]|uniref:DUF2946 family protein n=1 Tax=Azospirillum brasilense TaxID=192 RepID=UPI001FFF48B4|nr:DUF2946 family protein [Azospirillum brasilense]